MPIPGNLSSSSPDLLQPATSVLDFSNPADQVIRVFKADQQSCYIIISKDTTAKDVVAHTVNEFGLLAAPDTYSLCEVSVSPEGVIKQRRLPDQLSKLADRIQLNGSGLNLAPVARLRSSWEKLPSKYEKLFEDLQDVFDPSRNMAKYRNVLSSQSMQPPIIPLFPVVKKDLTFLHEGNDSSVDGLVNFEKLRMIAKEIRHVVRMTSANMDPALMFRQRLVVIYASRYLYYFLILIRCSWGDVPHVVSSHLWSFPVCLWWHELYISLVSSFSTPPQIFKFVFKSRFNLPASCLQEEEVEDQGSTNSNILDVQGGAHKKRVRRSSLLNAKKLYEDAQMARKVKQYLSNLTVETDEDKHQIMSLQCEPSYNTCELNGPSK
ncbi:hypothetical protein GOODEAATRI_000139 [Goodea atripinnis]|uniref:Ras-GEF domain-containing protein n=1 Tax=Goodea atripinnis TaxID=208336 RepID=A0ABV0NGA5_9TELE